MDKLVKDQVTGVGAFAEGLRSGTRPRTLDVEAEGLLGGRLDLLLHELLDPTLDDSNSTRAQAELSAPLTHSSVSAFVTCFLDALPTFASGECILAALMLSTLRVHRQHGHGSGNFAISLSGMNTPVPRKAGSVREPLHRSHSAPPLPFVWLLGQDGQAQTSPTPGSPNSPTSSLAAAAAARFKKMRAFAQQTMHSPPKHKRRLSKDALSMRRGSVDSQEEGSLTDSTTNSPSLPSPESHPAHSSPASSPPSSASSSPSASPIPSPEPLYALGLASPHSHGELNGLEPAVLRRSSMSAATSGSTSPEEPVPRTRSRVGSFSAASSMAEQIISALAPRSRKSSISSPPKVDPALLEEVNGSASASPGNVITRKRSMSNALPVPEVTALSLSNGSGSSLNSSSSSVCTPPALPCKCRIRLMRLLTLMKRWVSVYPYDFFPLRSAFSPRSQGESFGLDSSFSPLSSACSSLSLAASLFLTFLRSSACRDHVSASTVDALIALMREASNKGVRRPSTLNYVAYPSCNSLSSPSRDLVLYRPSPY